MKAKELKRIVSKMEDDWEIFVSPLILLRHLGDGDAEDELRPAPNPNERYKVISASQAGNYGENGLYNLHVVLAYDAAQVFTLEDDGTDNVSGEFVN